MGKEILSMEEAAELFGVSAKTFIKLLREENVPARKIGREWRFSRIALINWLASGSSKEYSSSESDSRHFDQIAGKWEEISRNYYDNSLLSVLLNSGLLQKHMNVVDFGAGDGFISRGISSKVNKVIAVDISEGMLKELEKKAGTKGINNIITLQSNKEELPLPKQSVNMICASMIMHHIEKPDQILKIFYNILKKDGILFVADFLKHNDKNMQHEMKDLWMGFDTDQMIKWIKEAGFKNISIEQKIGARDNLKEIFIITAKK